MRFPVIFKLPEDLRQDLTCHSTSWNMCVCVCVCVHSSLSTRVCLLCGEGSRREVENSFSPSWNWLLRLCFQGQCDHTHRQPPPPSELKSPRHMHTPLLSQPILCSGHTFPIVQLTTKQTAANISSRSVSHKQSERESGCELVAGWVSCLNRRGCGAFSMLLFCTFWPWLQLASISILLSW